MKVLVCDPISQTGIDFLKQQEGLEVSVLDHCHSEKELLPLVGDVSAMAVRSETKVTKALLEAAPEMKIVGRAGVGVDNIDIEAAWLRIAPGQELHLLRVRDFEPSGFEREFGRHFAVEFPADGFAGLKERLAKRGAELIDPIRETPFERFFFRDPNGYVFEVVDAKRTPEV